LALYSPSSSSSWTTSTVVRYRSHLFDPSDSKTGSCHCSDSCLRARSWGLRAGTPGRSHLNVDGRDPTVFSGLSRAGCRLHRGVWRGFEAILFHEHPTRGSSDRLCSTEVCNVDQRIVVRAEDVNYSPFLRSLFTHECFTAVGMALSSLLIGCSILLNGLSTAYPTLSSNDLGRMKLGDVTILPSTWMCP